MKKRILSVMLTLAMLVVLFPVMTLTSYAMVDVTVTDAAFLRQYLESDTPYRIKLQKDIKTGQKGDYKYWCTVKQSKWLDLNGHSISISNDHEVQYSTLFSVSEDARLTVYDSQKTGKSTIHYDGYINDEGSFRSRSIFDVSGKLEANGIIIEAGRSKSEYSAKYATTIYRQIFGDGIIAEKGSYITINSCIIYGRGNIDSRTDGRNRGIYAKGGSKVYFNDGEIRAKGGANCFWISSSATVKVMNGSFTCEKLDAIEVNGKSTKGIGKGRVGIADKNLGQFACVSGGGSSSSAALDVSSAKVIPTGVSGGSFEAESGDTVNEGGKTVHRLLSSDPKVTINLLGDGSGASHYFVDANAFMYGVDYAEYYTMRLYKDGVLQKSKGPFKTAQITFNVNEIFDGFTPEKGATYNLACRFEEVLNSVHAEGVTDAFYFKVVDDVKAPVITADPQTEIAVQPGASATMSVQASGSNLQYVWETSVNGGKSWLTATGTGVNSAAYTTSTLSKDHDGVMFRCRVFNSAGSVYSGTVSVSVKADKTVSTVSFTNFTIPVHGGTYTSDIQTAGDFPGKVTRYTFTMFNKSLNGSGAVAGDNVGFCVYVDLNSGYQWASEITAYLNGMPQEMRIHNDSMGTEYGFVWNFTIAYTDKIQITGQSPETVEYMEGDDVKLFVDAIGADGYQWQKYGIKNSGIKQQFAPNNIDGATSSTYLISGADSSLDGSQYRCALTCSEGQAFSKTFTLKLVDQKTVSENPFVDIYETDDYYDAVLWAYYADPQITNGMDETHFGPGLTVTRGQAVTFLWRSMGCPEPTSYYNPFEDVPSTEYYYKPILWAVEKGITKGVDETHFNPMDTLSTLHIITFLFRTTYPGKDGWDGDAAVWAADEKGRPFGIDIAVNNETDCPRCHVVQFLYCMSK